LGQNTIVDNLGVYGPRFIHPCSPITAKTVPAGDGWLHEPKLDGYRLQIAKDGRLVRLYSKGGYDWTGRFPSLAEALADIPCRSAVIDGELCFRTGIGAADFAGLQLALRSRQHLKLTVFAFDLLHRDGADLRQLPLSECRRRLEWLLARSDVTCMRLVVAFDDGVRLFAEAERRQLEGIVSKRKGSPYRCAGGPGVRLRGTSQGPGAVAAYRKTRAMPERAKALARTLLVTLARNGAHVRG
jgi:bifunctional non-homologous end joining protein LigD